MSFQAYVDNIKAKTGKTPDDLKLAEKKGLLKLTVKAEEIVEWLKKDFGLGHGHAMAIYAVFKSYKTPQVANKKDPEDFPVKLARPAQRALTSADSSTLKQLSKLSEKELSSLHGIGQNAVQQIKKALNENGLSFAVKTN